MTIICIIIMINLNDNISIIIMILTCCPGMTSHARREFFVAKL